MNETCKRICEKMNGCLKAWEWLPILIARITVGWVFAESGWGKLQHLDKVVEFFTSLGIPQPQLQAPFVAGVELICGLLIVLGFLTRIASVPLIITMIVAILTAKSEDLKSVSDLFGMSEYLYIVLLFWFIFSGGGKVALDSFLCKKNKVSQ